jgi:hypothetical protein
MIVQFERCASLLSYLDQMLKAFLEVLEETGYNLAGEVDPQDVIEMSIKEQKISLYIVTGIPEDFHFQTRTRKEISVCLVHLHFAFGY